MAVEWEAMGIAVAAELLLLLLITLPGIQRLRKFLILVSKYSLQPMLTVVPFALFLLADIYWKYDQMPKCHESVCTEVELDRHKKSLLKTQRNLLLVVGALALYWILYRVTYLLVSIEQLHLQVKKLKDSEKVKE